jgi:hypothetical protein
MHKKLYPDHSIEVTNTATGERVSLPLKVHKTPVQLEYPNRAPCAVAAGVRLAEEIKASLALSEIPE